MTPRIDARWPALVLLCMAAPGCAADELAQMGDDETLDASGTGDDEAHVRPGDLELQPPTTEARDLHRKRIAVGFRNTCAVASGGTVRCWGDNSHGALGDGTTTHSSSPVTVSGLTDVVSLAAGHANMLALRSNGTVYRWGRRWGSGASYPSDDLVPQLVPGLSDIVAIGSTYNVSCAVRVDGRVFCWGWGYLGDGEVGKETATPVQVAGITTAVATTGACVLLASGSVKCWGHNSYGNVGDGSQAPAYSPVTVQGIGNATAIASSGFTNFAVLADGTARSWGLDDDWGVLGADFDGDFSATPVPIAGLTDARDISATSYPTPGPAYGYACAALDDGTARCWGRNTLGNLGSGDDDDDPHPVPEPVVGLDGVVELVSGFFSTCVARGDGSMSCWGSNFFGELGDGTTTDSYTPVDVVGLSGVHDGPSIATGKHHSCGVRSDGTVKCWGDNAEGQIGDGTLVDRTSATLVGGLTGAIAVEAGGYHSCAVLDDGTARCWGRNASGELGDDGASGIRSTAPVVVQGLDDATQLAAAEESTCAIRSDGTAACWGNNAFGQLGDGTYTSSDVPVVVSGLTNAIAIDAAQYQVCALGSGGGVKCWGSNANGQLGNGSSGAGAKSNVPVTVRTSSLLNPPLANAVGIAVGSYHGCAAITGGSVKCWGLGSSGQLGQGASNNSSYAVTTSSIANAIDVSAGAFSSCALRSTGGARCWGSNNYGQLGNGDDTSTNTPVTVGMNPIWLSNATAIDSGYSHTCVGKGDGTIWCWGRNNNGQLGDTTTFDHDLPAIVAAFP